MAKCLPPPTITLETIKGWDEKAWFVDTTGYAISVAQMGNEATAVLCRDLLQAAAEMTDPLAMRYFGTVAAKALFIRQKWNAMQSATPFAAIA